jgi:hypothetical protein
MTVSINILKHLTDNVNEYFCQRFLLRKWLRYVILIGRQSRRNSPVLSSGAFGRPPFEWQRHKQSNAIPLELLPETVRTLFIHCWAQKMPFQTLPFFVHWHLERC